MSNTWIWLIIGVVLFGVEVVSGTFTLVFFGAAAVLVAGLHAIRDFGWPVELGAFGALGLCGLLLFRKKLLQALLPAAGEKHRPDINQTIVLEGDIEVGAEAQVSYQGSVWTAINESGRKLKAGERVKIARTEGIKLVIQG